MVKSVLTIAGSDSSGGAGIQGDIKTISALGCFAQSAITVLTAQNTMGVNSTLNVDSDFLEKQIDAVFDDIVPAAVKVGILGTTQNVDVVAKSLEKYKANHVVVDPVMVATSGSNLASDEVITATRDKLFPLAEFITPNIYEAQVLAGFEITNRELQAKAGCELLKLGPEWVLVTGGDLYEEDEKGRKIIADYLVGKNGFQQWFRTKRLETKNTHGTGCSLSSALACTLTFEYDLCNACALATRYVFHAIREDLKLGRGSGPINHMWPHVNEVLDIHCLFDHLLGNGEKWSRKAEEYEKEFQETLKKLDPKTRQQLGY